MITRRSLLATAALSPLLASCQTTSNAQATANWTKFVDQVTQAVISGCTVGAAVIPTATTIANVVASIYGPAAVATIVMVSGAVTNVASAICNAVGNSQRAKSAVFRSSNRNTPVFLGVTDRNVEVFGYNAHNAPLSLKRRFGMRR